MISEKQNNLTVLTHDEERVLQGQVAQLLNARELVINIGSDQGVRIGMKFAVLSDKPTDVYDPVTGELLDKVEREKTRVEAVEVRPRITICRTYRTRTLGDVSSYYALGFGRPSAPRKEHETLEFSDASYLPPLSAEQSYVKIKDRVVQVA